MIFYKTIYIFFLLKGSIKCMIPGLSVQKVDEKIIEKKRQDTLEICKIFEEQNNLEIRNSKEAHPRLRRNIQENPAINREDLKRVENIVEKLYDDVEEKITYRQRIFNDSTTIKISHRRFNFAPASLSGPEKQDPSVDDPKILQHGGAADTIPWTKKWHHGIVPYFIDPNSYDVQLTEVIIKAFDYFEKVTCIRLQRLRDRPLDKKSLQSVEWLYISNPSGIRQCVHSNERKPNQGVQMVVIGYDCMSLGEILHEIMHVLGFSHEHTRPDRDSYITILWDNIKAGYKKYFSARRDDPLNLPYDYASVLHYPPRAFSKNGQMTIMAQHPTKIGQREALSEIDILKVSKVYNAECMERNKEYLIETCPSVMNGRKEEQAATIDEINDYFSERIWPYGIVNYKIRDDMEFTTEEKENIQAVIRHIEKETCIEFRNLDSKRGSSEKELSDEDRNKKPTKLVELNPQQSNKDNVTLHNSSAYNHGKAKMTYSIPNSTPKTQRDTDNEISNDSLDNLKISKGVTRLKRNILPLRRHASNILTLVRSSEPGCQCHPPGRPNGHKDLVINNDCFNSVNDLLHVFVHVLGLDHQHNMHDRDLFLKIVWNNLTPEIKSEMSNKLPPAAAAGFTYDYQSVMHYPWLQIKDGVTNIMYPIWNDGWAMGHWQGLSYIDVRKLNLIYKEQCAMRSQSVSSKQLF
ncbi:uncharacterized protein LOC125062600 [Pieris napi]|uniref:uncharacterized protein LOC125062600 n=1 Tax=Pieris napi TaxID=78633 RepID=UPI001FBAA2EE|nr:uncharacterized protein LOC125062600 [Pieris napi]